VPFSPIRQRIGETEVGALDAVLGAYASNFRHGGGRDARNVLWALLLVMAVGALAGCGGGSGSSTASTYLPLSGRIVVVGDSLMVGTQTNLAKLAARHGFTLETSAVPGREVPGSLDDLARLSPGADVVVIGLGTNDASRLGPDAEAAAERVALVLDAVPGDTPIRWIDVYREPGTPAGDAAAAFNEALAEAAAADPRLEVLDWAAYVEANPQVMAPDGIHLTEVGYVERSRWLRDALVPLLTPGPSTTG
jgi:hypothetical protein